MNIVRYFAAFVLIAGIVAISDAGLYYADHSSVLPLIIGDALIAVAVVLLFVSLHQADKRHRAKEQPHEQDSH